MNNRKPKNKRGKLTRQNFIQEAPEPKFLKNGKTPNPAYPGKRVIVHQQVPKYSGGNLWGQSN